MYSATVMPSEKRDAKWLIDERSVKESTRWTIKKVFFSTPWVCKKTPLVFPVVDPNNDVIPADSLLRNEAFDEVIFREFARS
jgi:hypothetical protein